MKFYNYTKFPFMGFIARIDDNNISHVLKEYNDSLTKNTYTSFELMSNQLIYKQQLKELNK